MASGLALTFDPNIRQNQDFFEKINEKDGHRENRYAQYLQQIGGLFQSPNLLSNLENVCRNWIHLHKNMPDDIRCRESLQKELEKVRTQFKKCIKIQVNQTNHPRQLECFYKMITTINNIFAGTIDDKYLSFVRKKIAIRCFINRHVKLSTDNGASQAAASNGTSIYPILSIDGGGIRGIIPAIILVEIERITKKPISQLFRLIGGTSTGGILALGLTKPNAGGTAEYTAQDLLELYTTKGEDIFRHNPDHQADTTHLGIFNRVNESIRNPKYQTPGLFQNKFGDARLSDALSEVVITANKVDAVLSKALSLGATGVSAVICGVQALFGYEPMGLLSHHSIPRRVHLFTREEKFISLQYCLPEGKKKRDSSSPTMPFLKGCKFYLEEDQNYWMTSVAQVTSAAPTYFPPCGEFLDGGVLQNNPAIPSVAYAVKRRKVSPDDIFMVSLGTGCSLSSKDPLSMLFEAIQPNKAEEEAIRDILPFGAFHRFQHWFGEGEVVPYLDDIQDENIERLKEIGNRLVKENRDYLKEICKILSPDTVS